MASTFSPSLRLELMATGDQSGTWGDTTNTNLGTLLEQAITGYLSVAQGDVANLTLTTVNGGSDQARNAVVNITGALLAQRNVVVQTANKLYLFKNATTGGFAINVKTAAGTGVLVANGASRLVYSDGTNVVDGQFGPLLPSSDDGGALGSATIEWSDLFLASGGVINWANGNVTLTHSSALLTSNATIASSGSSVGYVGFQAISSEAAAAAGPIIEVYRNSASPAVNDVLGQVTFPGQSSTGVKRTYGSIGPVIVSPTNAAESSQMQMSVLVSGTPTTVVPITVIRTQVFAGSGTYTPNANMIYCKMEGLGGGGGGGGTANSVAGQQSAGGGGGAGGYSSVVASVATVGSSQTVTIGAAGTGGSAGNNAGGNGGDTSVGSIVVGKGGTGGNGSASGLGGAGGVAGTGGVLGVGQNGGPGATQTTIAAFFFGGTGGAASPYGSGGAGGSGGPGNPGTGHGSGGGGGASFNAGGTQAGGNGSAGYVIITEYCAA